MTKKQEAVERPRDIEPLDPNLRVEGPSNELARHHQRFEKVPAGFVRYRGKGKSPLGDDDARVELVIRTADGMGFAGPRKVHPEEWKIPAKEHGSIAAYRRVTE